MWLNALYYRVCDMHPGCARALFGVRARAPAGYNLNPRLNPVSGGCIFPGVVDLRGLYVFGGCYLRGLHIFGGGVKSGRVRPL